MLTPFQGPLLSAPSLQLLFLDATLIIRSLYRFEEIFIVFFVCFLDFQLVFFICMFYCLFYLLYVPLLCSLLLIPLHVRLLRAFAINTQYSNINNLWHAKSAKSLRSALIWYIK